MAARKAQESTDPNEMENGSDTASKEPDQAATEQQPSLIYCGPNLPKAFLTQFTVFQNGIPKMLDEHIGKCPAIKHLLVPVEKLADTLAATNQSGTAQSIWFRQIEAYKKGVELS